MCYTVAQTAIRRKSVLLHLMESSLESTPNGISPAQASHARSSHWLFQFNDVGTIDCEVLIILKGLYFSNPVFFTPFISCQNWDMRPALETKDH